MNTKKRERPAEVVASTGPNCPKTQPPSKENELMKSNAIIQVDTVTTTPGFVVRPDDLLMRSLCNGDEHATGHVDRSRYMLPAPPAAAKNRVTRKTLVREVLTLWLAGDAHILGECEEFYKAWKLTPEALAITARSMRLKKSE